MSLEGYHVELLAQWLTVVLSTISSADPHWGLPLTNNNTLIYIKYSDCCWDSQPSLGGSITVHLYLFYRSSNEII